MATDINVNQLIINKLTQAQYQAAKEAGQIVDTEIYMTTDGKNQSQTQVQIITWEADD